MQRALAPGVIVQHPISILTRAFARVQPTWWPATWPPCCPGFQSSLELSPECNLAAWLGKLTNGRVSILTRAFARVQPTDQLRRIHGISGFNPHSSFRPSATRASSLLSPRALQFQSSLELSPECNLWYVPTDLDDYSVSILTRAFARVQPEPVFDLAQRSLTVSILTRAFARVQPSRSRNPRLRQCSFNPHSSFRPSATICRQTSFLPIGCFNPHSSFRPSATQGNDTNTRYYYLGFNPHSSFRPSATRASSRLTGLGSRCFNPHSSFRPSATGLTPLSSPPPTRFNPHSSFRPSATNYAKRERLAFYVSILTRAFARVQPIGGHIHLGIGKFQSSLELSPECNA